MKKTRIFYACRSTEYSESLLYRNVSCSACLLQSVTLLSCNNYLARHTLSAWNIGYFMHFFLRKKILGLPWTYHLIGFNCTRHVNLYSNLQIVCMHMFKMFSFMYTIGVATTNLSELTLYTKTWEKLSTCSVRRRQQFLFTTLKYISYLSKCKIYGFPFLLR